MYNMYITSMFPKLYIIFSVILHIIYTVRVDLNVINGTQSIKNDSLSECTIKTRFLNLCNPYKNLNKKNSVQLFAFVKNSGKGEEISGYAYVPRAMKIVKGMLNPGMWRGGGFKSFMNKTSMSPCTDALLSIPLFITYHADLNCNIKKGNYSLHGLYPNRLAHLALGEKFTPGRAQVLLKYFSKNELFYCLEVIADIIPTKK